MGDWTNLKVMDVRRAISAVHRLRDELPEMNRELERMERNLLAGLRTLQTINAFMNANPAMWVLTAALFVMETVGAAFPSIPPSRITGTATIGASNPNERRSTP